MYICIFQKLCSCFSSLKLQKISMARRVVNKGFIPGYASTIADVEPKKRYTGKLRLISDHDPYELPRNEWQDNIDMWPAITFSWFGRLGLPVEIAAMLL